MAALRFSVFVILLLVLRNCQDAYANQFIGPDANIEEHTKDSVYPAYLYATRTFKQHPAEVFHAARQEFMRARTQNTSMSSSGSEPTLPRAVFPLVRNRDYKFLLPVAVGTPPQILNLVVGTPPIISNVNLETGSAITILFDRESCEYYQTFAVGMSCYSSSTSQTYEPRGSTSGCRHSDFFRVNSTNTRYGDSAFEFCIENYSPYYGNEFDGYLGLSSRDSGSMSFTSLFDPHWLPFTALNFDIHHPDRSSLAFGGYTVNDNSIVWSEVQSNNISYSFPLFHITLCNIDLLSSESSFWESRIAPSFSCILLPDKLRDMLSRWIDSSCAIAKNGSSLLECSLRGGINASAEFERTLQVLSFRLSEEGEILKLSLKSLLLPANSIDRFRQEIPDAQGYITKRFCIGLSYTGYIELGSMFLSSFYTILDQNPVRPRVGFSYKGNLEDIQPRAENCKERPICIGQQEYNENLNRCMEPACGAYFFQELNEETQQCQVKRSFQLVTFLIFILLALAELLVQEIYSCLVRISNRAFPAGQ